MAVLSLSSLLLLAGPVLAASDMASWQGLAGIQIQNKIFLTGGLVSWGNWSNTSGSQSWLNANMDPASGDGLLYEINLDQSIHVAQDEMSGYLLKSNHSMNGGTSAPGYVYGGMFSNYYNWWTFGGEAAKVVEDTTIHSVTRGREFSQGQNYFQEAVDNRQPVNSPVSDYISSGSYVSSPDQGLGWWFGGLFSSVPGAPLEFSTANDSRKVTQTSGQAIQVDMPADGSNLATFSYLEVPAWVAGRAESSLAWLPYGTKGVLVLMGGVASPADIFTDAPLSIPNNTFMTDLVIYDIAGGKWYNQSTLDTKEEQPLQMASFCSVVVPTADGNGHEIVVYGGYDGSYATGNAYDDVWVLSIPAFKWTKIYDGSGTLTHARQGSVCFAPNPSTLMTVGGTGIYGSSLTAEYGVDIFDLNTLKWTGMYDATSNDTLKLPDAVVKQIGGSVDGPGANAVQAAGLSSDVASLLGTSYQGPLRTYYPYSTSGSGNGSNNGTGTPTPTPGPTPSSNHTLAIALGVAIPVAVIAALILGFCCLKKRRKNREGVQRTQESRGNVFSWLGKSTPIDPAPEKSHTSDETAVNSTEYTHDKQPISEVFEAPGSNPTTPGWGNHGSPRVLSGSMAISPFMGSAEVDAQSRHEIMDHVPRDGQSFRQHPMYPRSFSGDQVTSMRSDSISHASTSVMPSRHYGGYVSPSYELPQDRSREDLTAPPADVNLGAPRADANPNASTHSLGLGAEHVHSPVALIPVAPVSRKPVNNAGQDDDRPRHQRNQSSMSSDVPNLPSPGPEEDRRRSRLIDTLPDPKSGQSSPIQPQTAKRSVYKEDLES